MDRHEEIVFFDDLGFGWVLDAEMLRRMEAKSSSEEILIQRSLAELLRNRTLL